MILKTNTQYGALEGVAGNGYSIFKGIPYAKPPVGDLRWKMPVKPESWEGVRKADTFGNMAMQRMPADSDEWGVNFKKEFYNNPEFIPPMSEDCLYLNVWTPAESPEEKLPVAFYIYGGGFGGGYSSEMEFDGEAYAKKGVVLVTINYRCGVFGFLAHPWLSAESERGISGNYGIFDQIAALKWVYGNIASFGGDPENITVFGQSAGCMSTQVLVSTELTGKMINKAILQSGVQTVERFMATPTLEKESEYGEKIVTFTGAANLNELRKMPAEELMQAKERFDMEIMRLIMTGKDTDGGDFLRIVPNVDGYLLKKNVREVFEEGSFKRIPYMAGCVESDLGTTDEDRAKGDPGMLARSDREWCIRQDELNNPPAYCYEFKHDLPTETGQETAFHSAELWYTFGTLGRCWRPMKEEDYALSEEMVRAWTDFMKCGDPNGPEGGSWRPCTKKETFVKIFK